MTCTVLLAVFTLGSCNGLAGNDEMDRYFQRSDTITLSAGDAKQANAVTHTINPWPSYVGDRRIVVEAAKTGGAIARYRSGTQPRDPLPAIGISTGHFQWELRAQRQQQSTQVVASSWVVGGVGVGGAAAR